MSRTIGNLISDKSISSLSGASQTLVAKNMTRSYLCVYNPNAANYIAVNPTGGTAALNGAGSITIPPLKMWEPEVFIPTNDITVIGTAADKVTCLVYQNDS